jgi:pyochelin synthetase
LTERGLRVDDLVLVSSHPVLFDVDDDLMIEALFIPNLHITLEQAGFEAAVAEHMVQGFMHVLEKTGGRVPEGSLATIAGASGLDDVGASFRRMGARSREARFADYVSAVRRHTGEEMPLELALGLFQVFRQSFRAARFTPPPYAGDIRFLRPRGASGFAPGMDRSTLEFWRSACLGEVSVADIEGNHFTCIDAANAPRIAEFIVEPLRSSASTARVS